MSIDKVPCTNINTPSISNGNQYTKKLSLFNRITKIVFDLYQKISNLFSRKPNSIKLLEGQIIQLTEENKTIKVSITDLYSRINNLTSRVNSLQSCAFSHGMEIENLKQDISPRNSSFQASNLLKETIYDTPVIKRAIK